MSGREGAIFILLMIVWLTIFFALAIIPGIAAAQLTGDGPPLFLVAYAGCIFAWWLGNRFGARLWHSML
jgi:hypothetical protein